MMNCGIFFFSFLDFKCTLDELWYFLCLFVTVGPSMMNCGMFFFFSLFFLLSALLTKLNVECQECHGLMSHAGGNVANVPYYSLLFNNELLSRVASI